MRATGWPAPGSGADRRIGAHDREREAGSVALIMLLAMTSLLFLGLVYAQLGSAADQRTQTQTVADSASVAAAHQLRDRTVGEAAHQLPYGFGTVLQAVVLAPRDLRRPACSAATRNWADNPHRSGFDCNAYLGLSDLGSRVRADVHAPAGEVATGAADTAGLRARTSSTARVVLDDCPTGLGDSERQAIADWIADRVVSTLGVQDASTCFTGDDEGVLSDLEDLYDDPYTTAEAIALIGEPNSIAEAVRQSFRIEIVE